MPLLATAASQSLPFICRMSTLATVGEVMQYIVTAGEWRANNAGERPGVGCRSLERLLDTTAAASIQQQDNADTRKAAAAPTAVPTCIAIGVASWAVEGADAALLAEQMLGNTGVELRGRTGAEAHMRVLHVLPC